jgi:hypothetical protein
MTTSYNFQGSFSKRLKRTLTALSVGGVLTLIAACGSPGSEPFEVNAKTITDASGNQVKTRVDPVTGILVGTGGVYYAIPSAQGVGWVLVGSGWATEVTAVTVGGVTYTGPAITATLIGADGAVVSLGATAATTGGAAAAGGGAAGAGGAAAGGAAIGGATVAIVVVGAIIITAELCVILSEGCASWVANATGQVSGGNFTQPQTSDSCGISQGRTCAANTSTFSFSSYLSQCLSCCSANAPSCSSASPLDACNAVCNAQYN